MFLVYVLQKGRERKEQKRNATHRKTKNIKGKERTKKTRTSNNIQEPARQENKKKRQETDKNRKENERNGRTENKQQEHNIKETTGRILTRTRKRRRRRDLREIERASTCHTCFVYDYCDERSTNLRDTSKSKYMSE